MALRAAPFSLDDLDGSAKMKQDVSDRFRAEGSTNCLSGTTAGVVYQALNRHEWGQSILQGELNRLIGHQPCADRIDRDHAAPPEALIGDVTSSHVRALPVGPTVKTGRQHGCCSRSGASISAAVLGDRSRVSRSSLDRVDTAPQKVPSGSSWMIAATSVSCPPRYRKSSSPPQS